MGKYDKLTFEELKDIWEQGKGPQKLVLKAMAKLETDEGFAYIHSCVRRMHGTKPTESIIDVLVSAGEPAAPYLIELIQHQDSVSDFATWDVVDHLKELGPSAGIAAAWAIASELDEFDTWLEETQAVLSDTLDEAARKQVLDKLMRGFSVTLDEAFETELGANEPLVAYLCGTLIPEVRSWEAGWKRQHQVVSRCRGACSSVLSIAQDYLSSVDGLGERLESSPLMAS